MKRTLRLLIILCVILLTLSACQLYTRDYKEDVLEYALITDTGDLSVLDQYPNLEYVDLRGSTCYEEILQYVKDHPHINVRYSVQLGDRRFNHDETEIVLNGYETSYEALSKNLKYLLGLKSVRLNQIDFSQEEYDRLIAAYPYIQFTYSVELGGRHYDHSVTELDLATLTSDQLDEAIQTISLLPDLTYVDLTNDIGESHLT